MGSQWVSSDVVRHRPPFARPVGVTPNDGPLAVVKVQVAEAPNGDCLVRGAGSHFNQGNRRHRLWSEEVAERHPSLQPRDDTAAEAAIAQRNHEPSSFAVGALHSGCTRSISFFRANIRSRICAAISAPSFGNASHSFASALVAAFTCASSARRAPSPESTHPSPHSRDPTTKTQSRQQAPPASPTSRNPLSAYRRGSEAYR